MSRRKEGRAGVLTNGKSWNFTYMIDQEEEGGEEGEEGEEEGETMDGDGDTKTQNPRRIELYQLGEIMADSEDNMRRIIGTDSPWHC